MRALLTAAFLFLVFETQTAWAYPQFIGHGYTSCMTCHYSPAGGGALTDYGRALFANTIAQKPFWSQKTDEELSESSGFLGKTPLPYWIRPGIKYRRLLQTANPGSQNKVDGDYRMQMDFNVNAFLDESQMKGFIVTISHLSRPQAALPNKPISSDLEEWAFREYYWRQSLSETQWLSVGFMDKPFGIRHPDHTAVNRTTLPLAQNDQVHGVMYTQIQKKYEYHAMVHGGNFHQTEDDRQWGLSGVFEYEPVDKIRYGASLLYLNDDEDSILGASGHTKLGLNDHNAWLFEAGARNQTGWSPFVFSQISYEMTRGLYLEPTFQWAQSALSKEGVQSTRLGLGLLYFPFQRLELRAQLLRASGYQENTVGNHMWVAQTQIHLSL